MLGASSTKKWARVDITLHPATDRGTDVGHIPLMDAVRSIHGCKFYDAWHCQFSPHLPIHAVGLAPPRALHIEASAFRGGLLRKPTIGAVGIRLQTGKEGGP
jgi:hypothetical protein